MKLFPTYGVELEYMIVNRKTLSIEPIADRILLEMDPGYEDEVDIDGVSWSHELVRHVLEVKTSGPAPALDGLATLFGEAVVGMNARLREHDAMLLPTAMHPWMLPHRETRLWPHGGKEIYETFHSIFNCRGHGWSNLQSAHLNLPFSDEESFVRLHAAIRLVLPLIPALAASSPILEGEISDYADMRLEAYRHNCSKIPSLSGQIIPEPVDSMAAYRETILETIYADLAPHDPAGTLRHEWVNARGAIARFDRNTIEIRLVDVQECPRADLALLQWIAAVIGALVESDVQTATLLAVPQEELTAQLCGTIRDAEEAQIPAGFWRSWCPCSCPEPLPESVTAGTLLRAVNAMLPADTVWAAEMKRHLLAGSLSHRILQSLNDDTSPENLRFVYAKLAECLEANEFYEV